MLEQRQEWRAKKWRGDFSPHPSPRRYLRCSQLTEYLGQANQPCDQSIQHCLPCGYAALILERPCKLTEIAVYFSKSGLETQGQLACIQELIAFTSFSYFTL